MNRKTASEIRTTIANAVKTAKPWLEFKSVRASGSGSHCSCFIPEPRLFVYSEGPYSKRLDFYLTPEGKVEAWEYKSDGGGEGWVRNFVRVVPFSQIDLKKVMEEIRTRLRYRKGDAIAASRTAEDIETAMNQI